jgi:hypothetical protein
MGKPMRPMPIQPIFCVLLGAIANSFTLPDVLAQRTTAATVTAENACPPVQAHIML